MTDSAISDFPVERFIARRRSNNNLTTVAASRPQMRTQADFVQYRTHRWANVIRLAFCVAIVVVLWIGWPGGATEIGHLYTAQDGSFSSRYTFLRGNGTETYRLWAASVRESDYPFAPARSRPVRVSVRQ